MCYMFGKAANYFFQCDFSVSSLFSNPQLALYFLPEILSHLQILVITGSKKALISFFFLSLKTCSRYTVPKKANVLSEFCLFIIKTY